MCTYYTLGFVVINISFVFIFLFLFTWRKCRNDSSRQSSQFLQVGSQAFDHFSFLPFYKCNANFHTKMIRAANRTSDMNICNQLWARAISYPLSLLEYMHIFLMRSLDYFSLVGWQNRFLAHHTAANAAARKPIPATIPMEIARLRR